MDLKILYEDGDLMAIDKPAGVVVFPEGQTTENTLIDVLLEKYPDLKNVGSSSQVLPNGKISEDKAPRHGIVHRLDKDTSGVLLVAKTPEALIFLQKQFKNREVQKRYVTLATGTVKEDQGVIHTFLGRAKGDPRKQKAYPLEHGDPTTTSSPKANGVQSRENYPQSGSSRLGARSTGLREAITEYKVLERLIDPSTPLRASYTLLEVQIKTGRKHQIRCHLAYLRNPIAGDKLYGFKDSPTPEGLERQFLHAGYLRVQLLNGEIKELRSELPEELQKVLDNLKFTI